MSQKIKRNRKSIDQVDCDSIKSSTPIVDVEKIQVNSTGEQNGNITEDQIGEIANEQNGEIAEEQNGDTNGINSETESSKNGDAKENDVKTVNGDTVATNGDSVHIETKIDRVTRKSKKLEETAKITAEGEITDDKKEIDSETTNKTEDSKNENDKVEMDPLYISDEPDPELQFDENSDMESGKGSPILSRCKTRRSQTRNIPTPKTPRIQDDQESDRNSAAPSSTDIIDFETPTPKKITKQDLNETDSESLNSDNLSTLAEAGSDSTRMEYINQDSGLPEENTFLNFSRERSVGETLKYLSSRKSIRPISDNYRKHVLKNNHEKADMNYSSPYPYRNSVERVTGTKRKGHSVTPDDTKRFKSDSPSLISMLTSPIHVLKNRLMPTEFPTSTPKLTAFKNYSHVLEDAEVSKIILNGEEKQNPERKWCSIM